MTLVYTDEVIEKCFSDLWDHMNWWAQKTAMLLDATEETKRQVLKELEDHKKGVVNYITEYRKPRDERPKQTYRTIDLDDNNQISDDNNTE